MKLKLAALLAILFTGTAQANILTNGNFEQGALGWSLTGNVSVATAAGGNFYFGAGSTAQDGQYAIAFNSGDSAPNGYLSQTFATTAGG